MIYLKKYVKYRVENDYILLCDCSSIQNYELPIEYLKILDVLKKGYNKDEYLMTKPETDLIEDLNSLKLLSDSPNSNDGFHNNTWISLGYNESEFFQE